MTDQASPDNLAADCVWKGPDDLGFYYCPGLFEQLNDRHEADGWRGYDGGMAIVEVFLNRAHAQDAVEIVDRHLSGALLADADPRPDATGQDP